MLYTKFCLLALLVELIKLRGLQINGFTVSDKSQESQCYRTQRSVDRRFIIFELLVHSINCTALVQGCSQSNNLNTVTSYFLHRSWIFFWTLHNVSDYLTQSHYTEMYEHMFWHHRGCMVQKQHYLHL